ncbi:MAG: argininosuccinate lyase [Candidatus Woesearchaeota archaeon]
MVKMKLWQKDYGVNKEIENFTVGNDYMLDKRLVKYDCIASIAHAKMLNKIDVLKKYELNNLIDRLNEIISLHEKGNFEINKEDEDCHTAIENFLVKKLGETGKKIHTARSRNDQVLTAIRLYEKEELSEIKELVERFRSALSDFVKVHGNIPMPGYTHMQKAMPTSIRVWIGSFIVSADDNIKLIESVFRLVDQSPLGSAAGFGVPVFDVDNEMTAGLMGFSKPMKNPIYAQHSRGKFESTIIHLMSQIMYDLNRLSTDLIIFSMKEFGYFTLPKEFCTGSSIMPQKKNPDVLELVRAKYHIVLGEDFKVKSLIGNLISGYNRDLQLTKEPLFDSIDMTKDCLQIMTNVVSNLYVNEKSCMKAITDELFAVEEANKLVKSGVPFREAYTKISERYR